MLHPCLSFPASKTIHITYSLALLLQLQWISVSVRKETEDRTVRQGKYEKQFQPHHFRFLQISGYCDVIAAVFQNVASN